MCPPFEMGDFKDMGKREAKKHFNWYISQVPIRIDILKQAYDFTRGITSIDLDNSPESLIKLWEWFIPQICVVAKTDDEIKSIPKEFISFVNSNKISFETLALAQDISIYFAYTFIYNYSQLSWGMHFKPKSLLGVNRAVVVGFSTEQYLFAENIINNLTLEVVDGKKDVEGLYKTYLNWSKKVF
jgi:hypothetical protein